MTRASLLHILDHVSGIPEAEIRELEQLAAAFPYCQTAHVLLAKADHDRGSMLASQRLRRAATYAADRQLLRQLLEQPIPERLAAPAPQHLVGTAAPQQPTIAPALGGTAAFLQTLGPEDVLPQESTSEDAAADGSSATLMIDDAEAEVPATVTTDQAEIPAPSAADAATDNLAEATTTTEDLPETNPEPTPQLTAETATPAPTAAETADVAATIEAEAGATPANSTTAETLELEALTGGIVQPAESVDSTAELAGPEATPTNPPAPTTTDTTPEELLPAVAPAIRPPAEAGISRFEFGLAEPAALPEPSSYQLPGLHPDTDDDDLELLLPPLPRPVVPAFHADAALAYALLGGGSRFGYALQMQDGELTAGLPADEFFEPDALLHAHATAHQPKRRRAPSSLDLIDRFLQNQPRLKSAAQRPAPAEEQDDLSVRSTSVVPQLASESLAKIMVRQGKIDKAIEIYERLMVRQPEKSAYFTDQIHQLQTLE
jgi:hypothetical protein